MAKRNVAANVVREWARENIEKFDAEAVGCLNPKARGLLHKQVIDGFNRAHKNARYETGTPKESSLIKVSIMTLSANGRKVPRKVTLTAAEVKELTGHSGKGRIPNAVKEQAAFLKTDSTPVPVEA